MNGEFRTMVEALLKRAADGGLRAEDAAPLAGEVIGVPVNCYPGVPGDACCNVAIFIALHGKLAHGRWPYNFTGILEAMVRHLQGSCAGITEHAVVITDSWFAEGYEKWKENIEVIKRSVHVEVCLVAFPDLIFKLAL